jgi:hypothetical protein
VIAELSSPAGAIEPSQGTHFFHNITSGNIFYLAINPEKGDLLNLEWLEKRSSEQKNRLARHLVVEEGLVAQVDGTSGRGIIYTGRAE